MFNRLRAFWITGYQCGGLGKNGDYLKQAMRKSCRQTGFESAFLQHIGNRSVQLIKVSFVFL